jgi:hypothetical protein
MSELEEQADLAERRKLISVQDAYHFFHSEDLSEEAALVQQQPGEQESTLQRLFGCFRATPKLASSLEADKVFVLALTKVKLKTNIQEHERIIKSVYRQLTKEDNCKLIGSHW